MTVSTPSSRSRHRSSDGTAIGDAGVADLRLRPHQPLRHGGHRQEEDRSDLLRRQAARPCAGSAPPGPRGQSGMAAGEDQAQQIVLQPALLLYASDRQRGSSASMAAKRASSWRLLRSGGGGTAGRSRHCARSDEPGPRIGRKAGLGPLLQGRGKGVAAPHPPPDRSRPARRMRVASTRVASAREIRSISRAGGASSAFGQGAAAPRHGAAAHTRHQSILRIGRTSIEPIARRGNARRNPRRPRQEFLASIR